jgi:HD domain
VIGERILSGVPGFGEVARSIRYENERWDGGGYPDGLARDQIPLATRIVFACDAYQAMTSDRPYRPAMGQVKARGELRDGAGTQFDPRVAPALLEILGDAAPPPACSPSESCNRARSVELAELAAEIGAHDLFVFRKVADQLYSHLGGRRPGARGGLGISNLTRARRAGCARSSPAACRFASSSHRRAGSSAPTTAARQRSSRARRTPWLCSGRRPTPSRGPAKSGLSGSPRVRARSWSAFRQPSGWPMSSRSWLREVTTVNAEDMTQTLTAIASRGAQCAVGRVRGRSHNSVSGRRRDDRRRRGRLATVRS